MAKIKMTSPQKRVVVDVVSRQARREIWNSARETVRAEAP